MVGLAVLIGEVLGSYRITHELGKGGMGVVYAGTHVALGSRAAVKTLLPRHSADQELVARFFNEARAATLVKHPGIVAVFDYGHHMSGQAYLVMELLEGETLAQRRDRLGRLPERSMLALMRQVAGALAAAHDAGIVHRDLKPHNLFVVADPDLPGGERVKVLDFGVCKLAGDFGSGEKTREGRLLGTPKYMAPEQCRGAGHVDARADVYAFGCILYELATGAAPFCGEGHGELIAQHIYETPPRPSRKNPAIDRDLEALIMRCLQKSPSARPPDMRDVAAALEQILRPRTGELEVEPPPPTTRSKPQPIQPGDTLSASIPQTRRGSVTAQHELPRTHRLSSAINVAAVSAAAMSGEREIPSRRSRAATRKGLWIGIGAATMVVVAEMLRWWLTR
jgi:serine/threonine protein kinase